MRSWLIKTTFFFNAACFIKINGQSEIPEKRLENKKPNTITCFNLVGI